MTGIEALSDILAKEALTDIAENFFGARRDMDSQLERFDLLLAEVRNRGVAADRGRVPAQFPPAPGLGRGRFLSGHRRGPRGIPAPVPLRPGEPPGHPLRPDPPGGPTPRWCWPPTRASSGPWTCSCTASTSRTPRTGKMRLTPHYQQILELAVAINARIHDLNSNMSPVCVLQYVKTFDPALMEKEKIVGLAPAGEGCSIDEKLAFRPIDIGLVEGPGPARTAPGRGGEGAHRGLLPRAVRQPQGGDGGAHGRAEAGIAAHRGDCAPLACLGTDMILFPVPILRDRRFREAEASAFADVPRTEKPWPGCR